MDLAYLLLTFHRAGFLFVRHRRTVFAISGSTSAMKEVISSEYFE